MMCDKHGVEMTAQRGGDPQCVACYLEALRQMPTLPEAGKGTIMWREYHGKILWLGKKEAE